MPPLVSCRPCSCEEDEDQRWAKEPLPTSVLGIRVYAALSTSPISSMFRTKVETNKIHSALAALFRSISDGPLPASAHWLTRTRLCWAQRTRKRLVNVGQGDLRTQTFPRLQCLWQHQQDSRAPLRGKGRSWHHSERASFGLCTRGPPCAPNVPCTVPWLRLAPRVAALLMATSKVLHDFCARTCARVFWVGLTIRKNDT